MENINLEKIVFLLDCLSRPKEATYLRMVIEEIGKDLFVKGFNMLALTRKPTEEIILILPDATEIVVQIVDVSGKEKVTVGIEAPREVKIYRQEIWERIKRECGNGGRIS